MKTKLSLAFGIIASVILIIVSVIQMEIVQDSKRDYRNEQEHNRAMGYYEKETESISPYAKKTRMAGNLTLPFVFCILAVSLLVFKKAKQVKWISIFNYIMILASILILGFTFTGVKTTTGGITFDEIGALWIIFGIISIIFSSIGLAKIPK
jgi:hypothetical protein